MLIVVQIIAVLTIVATILSIMYKKAWWIRVFDFPRLQIMVIQVVSFVVILIFIRDNLWINIILEFLLLISFVIQFSYITPYLPFSKKEVFPAKSVKGKRISIIVANVYMKNRDSKSLIQLIKKYNPMIVLTLETDHWWEQELRSIEEEYKYCSKHPLENTYGMILHSRIPLNNTHIRFLIRDYIPSIHTEIEIDGFIFRLICIHPEPPAPDEAETTIPRDRELVLVGKQIRKTYKPSIVIGDLNDVAWSNTSLQFRKFSQLKDPRRGRGFYNTFNAKMPLIRFALDHVFVTEEFHLIDIKRLEKINSDHFPIYINLIIPDNSN